MAIQSHLTSFILGSVDNQWGTTYYHMVPSLHVLKRQKHKLESRDRVIVLPDSEEHVILAWVVLIQHKRIAELLVCMSLHNVKMHHESYVNNNCESTTMLFSLWFSEAGERIFWLVRWRTVGSFVQRKVGNCLQRPFRRHWRQCVLLSARLWVSKHVIDHCSLDS